MVPKRQRLPIQSVAKLRGRAVRVGGLSIKVFPTNLPYSRFGVIIPKSVVPTAVARNRIKRIAFMVFEKEHSRSTPGDLLLIVSKRFPSPKDAMIKELSALLSRI